MQQRVRSCEGVALGLAKKIRQKHKIDRQARSAKAADCDKN